MSTLVFEIPQIAELAERSMQAVLKQEEDAQMIMGQAHGPRELEAAFSDYFQIAAAIELGEAELESDDLDDFADYGLDLLDRLSYLIRQLELMDFRNDMACAVPSFALWLARHQAKLDNLEATADGFAWMVNGLNDQAELAQMCGFMDEVIAAASETIMLDEDRSNAWRPWRVLNLNAGIAATRSLDAELMDQIFEKLGRHLPFDIAAFLADGQRQTVGQNVPDEVVAVLKKHQQKWPAAPLH